MKVTDDDEWIVKMSAENGMRDFDSRMSDGDLSDFTMIVNINNLKNSVDWPIARRELIYAASVGGTNV